MNTLSTPWRIAAYVGFGLVLAFLLLPILAVVPASLNKASYIYLPPKAYSGVWYERFFVDGEWRTAMANSVLIAVLSSLVAVTVGTLGALGLTALQGKIRSVVFGLLLAPMIVPAIVTGVALYRSALDLGLNGTLTGLVLAHALVGMPFVVVSVYVALGGVNRSWLLAASGLGAGPFTVFRTVTLPLIAPGVLSGAIFAFITSFDEVIVSVFLAGPGTKTIPVKIWETIRLEFTPIVAVAATVLIVFAVGLFALGQMMQGKDRKAT